MAARGGLRSVRIVLCSLLLASSVLGCAFTPGLLKNVTQETFAKKPPNESIVLGRLTLRETGYIGKLHGIDSMMIHLVSSPGGAQEKKELRHDVDKDGCFGLVIEPGEYRIVKVSGTMGGTLGLLTGVSYIFNIPTAFTFKVPTSQTIYIGSLLVEYKLIERVFKANEVESKTTVSDDFGEDMKVLRKKFPFIPQEVTDAVAVSH